MKWPVSYRVFADFREPSWDKRDASGGGRGLGSPQRGDQKQNNPVPRHQSSRLVVRYWRHLNLAVPELAIKLPRGISHVTRYDEGLGARHSNPRLLTALLIPKHGLLIPPLLPVLPAASGES
jgi:hypothetical protein